LWQRRDLYGICQAWRHFQGLKSRLGRLAEAEIGLRLVYGAACAIEDPVARLDMQAGIVRGLINVARARDDKGALERYTRLADLLEPGVSPGLHAPPRRFAPATAMPAFDGTTVLLVRHPLTIKNLRLMFGRQAAATIPKAESDHVETLASRLADDLSGVDVGRVRLCCSPANAARVLADALTRRTGTVASICSELESIESGDLTGLTEDDAEEHFPEVMRLLREYRANRRDGYEVQLPGGESVRHLTMRVAKLLLEDLFVEDPAHTAVLIAHTSSITALLNILSALDRETPDSSYRYYEVPVASVRKVLVSYSDCQVSVGHYE
jgi:broad specificity phosphatase PhoE